MLLRLALVFFLAPSLAFSQALSPDLSSLQGLLEELQVARPPLDPGDAASIKADAVAALGNIGNSTVPYRGVPEALYGARLGQRIANIFYHRHTAADHATDVMSQVQSTYSGLGPQAAAMASATGRAQAAASALPPDFSPTESASTTVGVLSCPLSPVIEEALVVGAVNFLALQIPGLDPAGGVVQECSKEPDGSVFLVFQVSGSLNDRPDEWPVFAAGSDLSDVQFNTGP